MRVLPVSGVLWVVGLLAITGSPPFGPFLSEFTILKAALDSGRTGVAVAYLALLALIFIGMATIMLRMAQGVSLRVEPRRESWTAVVPPAVLATVVLMLGIYLPGRLTQLLREATRLLGGL